MTANFNATEREKEILTLRAEIVRLQEAKRRFSDLADERAIEANGVRAENERLRAALMKIRDVVGTSTEAWLIAERALEQEGNGK